MIWSVLFSVLKIFETFHFLNCQGMFQNAFHIALYNKCDINEKADILFKEEKKQIIVSSDTFM
jgi:hypothetical protein